MRAVIVVPTYNERGNIEPLVTALEAQFRAMPHDMHVLVVDDSSPDGTAAAVRELQQRFANLHLLEGRKAGLGTAYVRGLRYALDGLAANVVLQMDADLSHKPEDVPRLMAALEAGADFVIGSRYVAGGSVPAEWQLHRRLMSLLGNLATRHIAGLHRVHDCTAGFRAIRAALVRDIELGSLRVEGYAFLVAMLHAAMMREAKIVEVPVDFIERRSGQSKLGLSDIVEFIVNVWWIRFQSSRTFIKLGAVGAAGVAVNLGSFAVLLALGMSPYAASPLAVALSIVSNFTLNRYWTFRAESRGTAPTMKGRKFSAVSLLALAASYGTFLALSAAFPESAPILRQLAAVVPATLVNYFLDSYWPLRSAPRAKAG